MSEGEDLTFVGRVLPAAGLSNGPTLKGGEFSDKDIDTVKLAGLPLTWEHDEQTTVGLVEHSYTGKDGHKYIVGRVSRESPFGDLIAKHVSRGQKTELSLMHMLGAEDRGGVIVEQRIPTSVGITKKGLRPNCHIDPNSVRSEPASEHLRRTIYRTLPENPLNLPNTSETKMSTEAKPEETVAAETPKAEEPAKTEEEPMGLDFFANPENILKKGLDGMTPEKFAALAARIAQEGKAFQQQLAEKEEEAAKIKTQMEDLEKKAQAMTQAQEQDYLDLARKYAELMSAHGGMTAENALEVYQKVRSQDPDVARAQGHLLQQQYAYSADLEKRNAALEKQLEDFKNSRSKQVDDFSQYFEKKNVSGLLDKPADRFPGDNRPQKRAAPEATPWYEAIARKPAAAQAPSGTPQV